MRFLGLGVRVSLLSGHRLLRILLMLVVMELVSSACVALPLLCLHLLLLSLSLSLTAVGLSGVCFLLRLVGFFTCCVLYGYQGADADA